MEYTHERPQHYHRDGTPIVSPDPAIPAWLVWAMEFEVSDRTVAKDKTLYGERLSTVFLGLDHSFSIGLEAFGVEHKPILFETMLFAPESKELHEAKRERIRKIADSFDKHEAIEQMEIFPEETYIEKHYPHDQLQTRYSTEAQALKGHNRIKLQCLIPPRWRRFLLYTIGRDALWS